MKYLRVTMSDGSMWDVPAEVIAKDRALSYAREDTTAFEREFKFTLGDNYELKEWAANNMNWSDVKDVAKQAEMLPPPPVDYQEGWVNGNKVIIEY